MVPRLVGSVVVCCSCLVLSATAGAQAEAPSLESTPESGPEARESADVDVGVADGERTLVAVLFLATGGVNDDLAENLTEVLVASVASSAVGRFAIVGREQFGRAMGVGGEEETLRCAEDPVCLGRIGAVVGAEEIVLGSLGERAGRYIVNLGRLDVGRARLVHRVFRTTPAELTPLIAAVNESARELMQPPPGAVRISVNVEEHELEVDGDLVEPDPDGVLRGLEPGEHRLVVRAEGYNDGSQTFAIARGETLELSINLGQTVTVVEAAPAWYRRWWVWTLVGVAVVGAAGATTAVLLTQEDESARGTLGTVRFP